MLIFIALLVGSVRMNPLEEALPLQKRESACYGNLGCFSTDPPFTDSHRPVSYVPESPDLVLTQFWLFTRDNKGTAQILDARNPELAASMWTNFKPRKTQVIIHGFIDNPNTNAEWLEEMKDELLKQGDYNVIITDWSKGNLPPYTQATANTRIVGAQIALLVQELISTNNMSAADFHIIGHSLGSHVAGYAGERIPGLARITGLDPAGPYYEGTDIVVRLDPSDALFVDTLHTDAQDILHLGLGTHEQSGDSDFFPNLGHDQPGCTHDPVTNILEFGILTGTEEFVACNHFRSIKFFTESINSQCPFMAFPCASETDFDANRCHSCTSSGCARMGFYADQHIPPSGTFMKYYLTTDDDPPFCQYHLDITVKFATTGMIEERGTLSVKITGDQGSTGLINLTDLTDPMDFKPGTTQTFYVMVPADIGSVQSVDLTWLQMAALLDPLHWNLFGLRHPTLAIDEVDILREEPNVDVHLCANHLSVETAQTITISTQC